MKIETVKNITRAVIGASVWWVVSNIIDNNVSPENRRQKAEVWIGSAAIGWVVAEQTDLYVDRKIDKMFEALEKKKNKPEPKDDMTEKTELQDDVQNV